MKAELPKFDKLAGDQAGSDLGPGAPDEASAHEEAPREPEQQLQSPLGVGGMTPAGPPVDENPAADPGGAP